MNTIAKLICITVFLVLSNNNYAVEIVYDGQDCFNTVDDNDITATGLLIQSKFEVIEDVGQGMYRLRLTGGFQDLLITAVRFVLIMSLRWDISDREVLI